MLPFTNFIYFKTANSYIFKTVPYLTYNEIKEFIFFRSAPKVSYQNFKFESQKMAEDFSSKWSRLIVHLRSFSCGKLHNRKMCNYCKATCLKYERVSKICKSNPSIVQEKSNSFCPSLMSSKL